MSAFKPEHMSGGGALQQRTTYLISLTLVKIEAMEENGGEAKKVEDQPGEETRVALEVPKPQRFADPDGERRSPGKDHPPAAAPALARGAGPDRPPSNLAAPERLQKTKSADLTGCTSPSASPGRGPPEPSQTPSRTSLQIRPLGQRPVSLLKSHSSVTTRGRDSREGRDRSPPSAQSLDRKDCRAPARSPGPCRASWAEASRPDGWRELQGDGPPGTQQEPGGLGTRDIPKKERLKIGSASLPVPSQPVKPAARKGKSRTLDNSDLNSLSEEMGLAREAQQAQRGVAKDRKMLKFISGIFTKTSGPSATVAPPGVQRDSSEEEVNLANSQEWTLSRSIPELKLGILGNLKSGKSALVNKYITGSYVALEKPDGGRYKKEVLVDGQSHLLLIREESGSPDAQFCSWVDAVILVFSLENETSFQELYQLYSQLSSQRADVPIIVVGTQDKISSSNPRVIDDQRARQLCIDVRHSLFYETCATYGFNVDRVFSEAAQKIVAQRRQVALQACKSLPNSPSHSGGSTPGSTSFPGQASNGPSGGYACSLPGTPVVSHRELRVAQSEAGGSLTSRSLKNIPRRPSLFKNRDSEKKAAEGKAEAGAMRGVPIKQNILWKRSGSSLNKEWKKKFVTLSNSGTLSYHSSANDYTQNIHGKEMDLLRVTVKVPGKRPPRAVAPAGPSPVPTGSGPGVNGLTDDTGAAASQACLATPSAVDERPGAERALQRCPSSLSTKAQSVDALEGAASAFSGKDSGHSSPMSDRKKNRRKKSMNQKGDAAAGQAEAKRKMWKLKSFGSLRNINKTDEENADFIIVSFTGQTWHFEAQSLEERDSWVSAIESQILASLQSCESGRNKARRSSQSEAVALQAIRNTKGNSLCVDCEALNPTWASLNLGALICIECSGIHRNLGTHLSRVRSLDLDDWPGELTQVLAAIGNHMANSIWESCTQGRTKPAPSATREERESWIRAKYEQREFVAPLQTAPGTQLPEEGMPTWLLCAVTDRDLPRLLLLLAHSTKEQINGAQAGAPSLPRTALHAACQLGDVVMTQLLIWYGIDVRARDHQGQTAMRIARKSASRGCMDILLQHDCPSESSPPASTPVLSRRSSTASLGRTSSRKRVS